MSLFRIFFLIAIKYVINVNSESLKTMYSHTHWWESIIFNINAFNNIQINKFDFMCWKQGIYPFKIYKLSIFNQTYSPYIGLAPSKEWVLIYNNSSIHCPMEQTILTITLNVPVFIKGGTTQAFWMDYYGILARRGDPGTQNTIYTSNADIAILYGSAIWSNTIHDGEIICTEIYYTANVTTATPTSQTKTPSYTPTNIPTMNATLMPSVNPSKLPTFNPTFNPTVAPTVLPSEFPSKIPTEYPTLMLNGLIKEKLPTVSGNFFAKEKNVYLIIGGIFGFCLILSLIAVLHKYGLLNICCKIGDNDNILVFIILAFRLSDFVTDILFVIYISEYIRFVNELLIKILFMSSIGTLVMPFILNILFTCKIIKYKKWLNNNHVSSYFYANKIFIPISIVTMDVWSALKITQSKFLGLNVFNSGITSYEIYKFEYIKIISITLFENIPTLAIQIIFIIKYEYNILSLLSTIFTGFSILITILSYFMNRELVHDAIPVSYFISFKVPILYYKKIINKKIGLQRKLKNNIYDIIGSRKFNDIEVGNIDAERVKNGYIIQIHFISRIHDVNKFDFDPETVKHVCTF